MAVRDTESQARSRKPKARNDVLAKLIDDAMALKGREMPDGRYVFSDLADDSGRHWAYVRNVARGLRPTVGADVIHDFARALAPYLDEDQALIAAGHPPRSMQRVVTALTQLKQQFGENSPLDDDLKELEAEFDSLMAETRKLARRLMRRERSARRSASQPCSSPSGGEQDGVCP